MNNLYYRISNAFKICFWALKNPYALKESNFKILSDLLGLILEVANKGSHRMTHLAYVHPEEGEQQIVSIWAGAGIGSSPTKRIAELLEENSRLKTQLSNYIASSNEVE